MDQKPLADLFNVWIKFESESGRTAKHTRQNGKFINYPFQRGRAHFWRQSKSQIKNQSSILWTDKRRGGKRKDGKRDSESVREIDIEKLVLLRGGIKTSINN